jgi:hypothetical protein
LPSKKKLSGYIITKEYIMDKFSKWLENRQPLFGKIATYIDPETGEENTFKISSDQPNDKGLIFGVMIGGNLINRKGAGEWVNLSDLTHFR